METGEVLQGRFHIEEPLRRGGMGDIWLARDDRTGGLVVVKVLRASQDAGARASSERRRRRRTLLNRFERECDLLQRLDHPGIPRLLARGFQGLDPYMVMEYIEGPALDEFLRLHTPTPAACAAIMTQILDALAYAHANGVVHRDVKPHNVIVGADGVVHLIDFGIAFLTDPDATRYTEEGHTPGSTGYRAPELILSNETVTTAADVYGAGCVYFLLLTGRQPFCGRPTRSADEQHLYDPPPRVSGVVDHVAPEIDDIVDRMLAKDPASRPRPEDVAKLLNPHLPAPGDPAPDPALTPDPTARFRTPDGGHVRGAAVSGSSRRRGRRSSRLGTDRPSRAQYDELVVRAAEEVDAGEPGPAIARLDETLADVRDAWGLGYLPVARACLRCGDAARLEGLGARARARYRDADRQVAGDSSREGAELRLEARIGLAECLVPEERLDDAVAEWSAAARDTLAIDPVPRRLNRRLREVALELQERGHGAAIRQLLARLPDC
ncbi:serine/threonine-protein kinase [Actinomadura chokoriensis]|uniref:serine/threonine-protein kinase n=1 Tax=Actinomadura chokoriensis TaxID=454156 RepID=UPI0031F98CD2